VVTKAESDSKVEVESAAVGFAYEMAYSVLGCTGSVISQNAMKTGVCSDSEIWTCTSGVLTITDYTNSACTTGATTYTQSLVCGANVYSQYNGVMSYYQYSCGSTTSAVASSVSTPSYTNTEYSAAGCDSSTMLSQSVAQQNACYGYSYTIGSVVYSGSNKVQSSTYYNYTGSSICANTPGQDHIDQNLCKLQNGGYYSVTLQNGASQIMGNLPMIAALVTGVATLLSFM